MADISIASSVRYTVLAVCLALLTGCGSGYKQFPPGTLISLTPMSVFVYPLAGDDLEGPCAFDLVVPEAGVTQAGVLVIYERGDSRELFVDDTVQATARALHYAVVWAHECDAKSSGSFQADASKGPAHALFAALTQLGTTSNHPELATDGVVLYGFSAAGVLAATMANDQPARMIGAVEYASGDLHVNLEEVPVTAAAAQIPTLLLANGEDEKSGTFRSLDYFKRGRLLGAPWAYGVQHDTDHCCTLSTRSVVLPWLTAVAGAQANGVHSAATTQVSSYPNHTFSQFTCTPDDTTDAQEYTDCEISAAEVASTAPSTGVYGWLPDQVTGDAWLTWVLNPKTN